MLDHVLGLGIMLAISSEEAHKALVDLGRNEQLGTFQRPNFGREAISMVAAPLDDVGDTASPQRTDGGVDRYGPRPQHRTAASSSRAMSVRRVFRGGRAGGTGVRPATLLLAG